MVKVSEFCCGCSLRSGSLTVAWSLLICSTLLLISNVYEFGLLRRYSSSPYYPHPSAYLFAYNVIQFITGIAVSVTALWAIHKNKIIFLNGLYWYLGYTAASFFLSVILLIFKPLWEEKLEEARSIPVYYSDNRIMSSILYLFISGIFVYFTWIVKSYRDYGLRNEAQNVQFVGPDATTVGFIAA